MHTHGLAHTHTHTHAHTDLRQGGDEAEGPGEDEHHPAALPRLVQRQRVQDGEVAVQADGHQDEGRQVQAVRPATTGEESVVQKGLRPHWLN